LAITIFSHPSDIAKSAIRYIAWARGQVKPSPFKGEAMPQFMKRVIAWRRDLERQADIIFMFMEYLRISSGLSADQPLTMNWSECERRTISEFVNRWLPLKVKTNTIEIQAPAVLRKWLIWCRKRNILGKERFNELIQSLPRGKGEEIRRLQRAGELLFRLHSPVEEGGRAFDRRNILSINHRRQPVEYREGYMKVRWIGENMVYLETREGVLVGPVLVGSELTKTLRIGNVMFVELGKYARCWKVLKSGNVYAEDVIG